MEKWQGMWQQLKPNQIDIDKLTNQLLKLERRTRFQRLLFSCASLFTIYSMLTHLSFNIYNSLAFMIIAIGLLFILVPLFKNRLNSENVNNQQYIYNRIKYLREKLLIPKLYLLIFIVLFILALNIAFLGAFKEEDIFYRILFHSFTVILFVILFISRKTGIRSYEKEILPLIDKFEKINKQE